MATKLKENHPGGLTHLSGSNIAGIWLGNGSVGCHGRRPNSNLLTNKDTIIGVLVASEMWRKRGSRTPHPSSTLRHPGHQPRPGHEAARLDGTLTAGRSSATSFLPALIPPPIITVLIVNGRGAEQPG